MAILFAATHPERVAALVLYGTYAKRTWSPDYPGRGPRRSGPPTPSSWSASWDWEADMRMRCPSADEAMRGGGRSGAGRRPHRRRSGP